jgi:hypothetical protein
MEISGWRRCQSRPCQPLSGALAAADLLDNPSQALRFDGARKGRAFCDRLISGRLPKLCHAARRAGFDVCGVLKSKSRPSNQSESPLSLDTNPAMSTGARQHVCIDFFAANAGTRRDGSR